MTAPELVTYGFFCYDALYLSKERAGGSERKEEESLPYYQAARFRGEAPPRRAYSAAQGTLFQSECNPSTYRIILNDIWHVGILGDEPPAELHERLNRALGSGDPVSLPEDVLTALSERGQEQRRIAPWVERHYRPGR